MTDISITTANGEMMTTQCVPHVSLARTIFLLGLWQDVPLCSGLGKCGLCAVRFLSEPPTPHPEEHKRFSGEELADGWRLACLHDSVPCSLELPRPRTSPATKTRTGQSGGNFLLAVDLGTTSIHCSALVNGKRTLLQTGLNPQTGLGSEVMSRLALAADPQHARTLRSLVIRRLEEYAASARKTLGGQCIGMAISGNSAMTYILLGLETATLAHAPYSLPYAGNDTRTISPNLPPAFIPPLYAPFVGADISAGLAAIHFSENETFPHLLADMGTNGEFVLSLSETERICASVPMGPALEGVGLRHGQTAGPGVISAFAATPAGIAPQRIPNSENPGDTTPHKAMTGTGYLSLAALLLANGVLDEHGHFRSGCTPLAMKLKTRLTQLGDEPAFAVMPGLIVPASDMEEILKVKAAFNLAVSELLQNAGLAPGDLAAVHVAGAMGEHVSLDDLETLGFLPHDACARTTRAGNTSLAGTELLLTRPEARLWLAETPESMRVLDLTDDPSFGNRYVERMRFTHVD
ncbi:ASKHA domain-containing protein [Pseudodesulfovibrio senegalensis]|uniref:DUF4445 domain-containing protein n=1 Tax=Pseudodesulfovibrio senegalensis TaxID=1721087 RepID=A0A6N6N4X9_9BACT|nr:ASKHA domain-containing protein [Pseudodesulfovibrio senegalensis]KAB1442284.1 DUF4445 domain-containing protein [Pseudodesulfovibrio senegalensis]